MPALSESARIVLEQMEPYRGYEASELLTFAPDLNMDALRDVMHELWIAREVERFGIRGWRRVRSTRRPENLLELVNSPASAGAADGKRDTTSLRIGAVTPEDLFDHDAFAEWFKQA